MNPCAQWRDPLTDHALGLPAGTELEAHLAACAACAGALAALRSRARDLDSGLRRLMASEPSPHLAARVLAAASSKPSPPAWVRMGQLALAGVACLALIAGLLWQVLRNQESAIRDPSRLAGDPQSAMSQLSHWQSPTTFLLRPPLTLTLGTVPRLGETYLEKKK